MKVTLHNDGTVTFFSVYLQVWLRRSYAVSDRELAAMDEVTRKRVARHIGKAYGV